MLIKKIVPFLIASGLLIGSAVVSVAQDPTSQNATAQQSADLQQQQEEKIKVERKAIALLEQVITESQALKLPENRIRVQIAAGDMLWDRSAARARGLFADAGAVMAQMMLDADRTDRDEVQTLNRLRQDLVLTAGRHDAELGYQLLHSTQQQAPATNATNGRRFGFDQQSNLEQNLLATIAVTDPKVAYQKATESLDKGEYPTSLGRVLAQLQSKDPESFRKLSDKALSRLGADNLLASREASGLALNLLQPGPRPNGTSTGASTDASNSASPINTNQVLSESAFHDLMDNAITASLSVTLTPGNNNVRGGGGRAQFRGGQPNQQTPLDDTQVRQNNARALLFGLQAMLPQIDQYLPERAPAVRQKLTDLGGKIIRRWLSATRCEPRSSRAPARAWRPLPARRRLRSNRGFISRRRRRQLTKATPIARCNSPTIISTNRRALRSCRRWTSSVWQRRFRPKNSMRSSKSWRACHPIRTA